MNWQEILGWDDNTLEDIRFVGYAYVKQGLYDIALKIFEGLLAVSNDDPYDLKTLGALHLQIGNPLVALQYFDKSLKKEPKDLQTQLNRTKALFILGYRKQGIAEAKKLVASDDPLVAKNASALILAFPSQKIV